MRIVTNNILGTYRQVCGGIRASGIITDCYMTWIRNSLFVDTRLCMTPRSLWSSSASLLRTGSKVSHHYYPSCEACWIQQGCQLTVWYCFLSTYIALVSKVTTKCIEAFCSNPKGELSQAFLLVYLLSNSMFKISVVSLPIWFAISFAFDLAISIACFVNFAKVPSSLLAENCKSFNLA